MVDKIILELPADTVGGDIVVSTETRGRAETAAAQAEATAAGMVVSGTVTGDNLVLTKADSTTVVAGDVRGPKGNDGSNVLPTDEAIAQAITTPGSETQTQLNATFVGRKKYALGPDTAVRAFERNLNDGISADIVVLSDSTGYVTPGWVSMLAEWLGERFPSSQIGYRRWESGAWSPRTVASAGTGGRRAIHSPRHTRGATVLGSDIGWENSDLDVAMQMGFPAAIGGANGLLSLANRWTVAIDALNRPRITLAFTGETPFTLTASSPATITAGLPTWLRAVLDADNGSGASVCKFFESTDGVAWTQIGTDLTGIAGAFGTSPTDWLTMGSRIDAEGAITTYDVRIVDGAGKLLSPPLDEWLMITGSNPGESQLVGAPTIEIWNASISGGWTTNQLAVIDKMIPRSSNGLVIVAHGHNAGDAKPAQYAADYLNLVDAVEERMPAGGVLLMTQNPELVAGVNYARMAKAMDNRTGMVRHLAARRGLPVIDVFTAFHDVYGNELESVIPDGVHPNAEGNEFWCTVIAQSWADWAGRT